MLVFHDRHLARNGAGEFAACFDRVTALRRVAPGPPDERLAALIRLGMLESALADAWCPERDAPLPPLVLLRAAMDALAAGRLDPACAALRCLDGHPLPSPVSLSVPEGFAFYALYPEACAAAATAWAMRAKPLAVVCLGLRSIGTTLASVVAAALEQVQVPVVTWTLRPRGHPFDRHIALDPALAERWDRPAAIFLVVDEGPGLSGSSCAAAADALAALGVPDERIVFLTTSHPDVTRLRSARARNRWTRHAAIAAPFTRRLAGIPDDAVDIGAGAWRARFCGSASWPAVQPQHERTKFAFEDSIVRFAGLGDAGADVYRRAERLGAAGWSSPPRALARGFLAQPLAGGEPMTVADVDASFLGYAADYIAWLRAHERTDAAADTAPLAGMLRVNVRQGLGDDWLPAADNLAGAARAFAEPAIAVDGRVQLHEWLRTPAGVLKTDALDHHRDHFYPGVTDGAWDVAGVIVEARLPESGRTAFLERYVAQSGDRTIAARLPFHVAAYSAFRLGYAAMAMDSVDANERRRFERDRARYAAALASALTPSAL